MDSERTQSVRSESRIALGRSGGDAYISCERTLMVETNENKQRSSVARLATNPCRLRVCGRHSFQLSFDLLQSLTQVALLLRLAKRLLAQTIDVDVVVVGRAHER